MSLDRTHDLVLADFAHQRETVLPRLREEHRQLQGLGVTAESVERLEQLQRHIREIEDNEQKYLLEFGTFVFRGNAPPATPKPEPTVAQQQQQQPNNGDNHMGGSRSLQCHLRLETGAAARVSVWSTSTDICADVLYHVTGMSLVSAYESIEVNGQALTPGMVLWDIQGIKLAPPIAAGAPRKNVNRLTYRLKPVQSTWLCRVVDSADGSVLSEGVELPDWCSEKDISHLIGRAVGSDDAYHVEPNHTRVRTTLGDAVRERGAPSDGEELLICRSDRIVSRRRKQKAAPAIKSGTLEAFIKRTKGEQRHEIFKEYIDMLARLKISGNNAAAAQAEVNLRKRARPTVVEEAAAAEESGTSRRRRRNATAPAPSSSQRQSQSQQQQQQQQQQEGVCVQCGSDMTYVRSEASYVCRGYDEECIDCEGNLEVVHRQCGYTVAALDNSPSALPFGSKPNYTHSTYKRIVRTLHHRLRPSL